MSCLDTAYKIVQKFHSHGFIAYYAGGWVRDFLMDHPSDDIDIATNATTNDVEKIFEKTIPVGVQFGIIIVVEDGHQFEIATFRKDQGYEDGRRPIGIEHATAEEDAIRRDFTINGMFYDPLEEKVLDYVDGQKDLHNKVIRAIGNPHQRFMEDRLRMIRAIRYSCRFHFAIDPKTIEAIQKHASSLFPSVAIERVWQEFMKMNRFGDFKKFLVMLFDTHLLHTLFPFTKDLDKKELDDRLKILPSLPKDTPLTVKLLKIYKQPTLEEKLTFCDHFKLSNQERNFLLAQNFIERVLSLKDPDDVSLVEIYAQPHFSLVFAIYLAHLDETEQKSVQTFHLEKQKILRNFIKRRQEKKPVVTSKLLLKEGIKPGELMGSLLKEADKASILHQTENSEKVIEILKKGPFWPSL